MKIKLSNWQTNLLLFFLVALIIYTFHLVVLKQAFEVGFSPDDWDLYLRFKAIGESPIIKIGQVWAERGLYTTPFIYYMGLLDTLSGGLNYRTFQSINVFFKIAATVSLFPLILIVFKRKSLAFLTTVMYGISYSSIGSLDYPVKGSDYVSIFWMNIFLIVYYFIIKKNLNFIWYILTLLILIISISFSPIRMFPIFALLPIIEIYLLLNKPTRMKFGISLLRLLFFFSPFIILILRVPSILIGGPLLGIYQKVMQGEWSILLSPISGIGYTFMSGKYWGIFGLIREDNLGQYLSFLMNGPLIVFGFLTFLLSFIIQKRKRFFFSVLIVNFTLDLIAFFVAYNYKYLSIQDSANFYSPMLYSVIIGCFIISVSLIFLLRWLRNPGEYSSLLPSIVGFIFLFVFVAATWAFAPSGTYFSETSYYLIVATIGTSLFLSNFIILLTKNAIKIGNNFRRFLSLFFISFLAILILVMNYKQITEHFIIVTENGRSSIEQEKMQKKIKEIVGVLNPLEPIFVYFDGSEIGADSTFYADSVLLTLPAWMHSQEGKIINGCAESFYKDKKALSQLIISQNGEKGFSYRGFCVEVGEKGVYYKDIFYKLRNFYAFKLKDRGITDIKKEILQDLEI